MKEDDIEYIISLYDGGIAYTDKCIGDLFEMLRTMGLYGNSLIILTADHGEEFQEHGLMLHGNPLLYEELMRVPLIIKLPGDNGTPREISNPVESIDIMPSILDLLGIEQLHMQGKSFVPLINGRMKWKGYAFAFGSHIGRAFIRNGRWKLIADHVLRKDGYRLFDLLEDPMERHDIRDTHPEITKGLQNKILMKYQSIQGKIAKEEVILTEEQKEKLRSLGYTK